MPKDVKVTFRGEDKVTGALTKITGSLREFSRKATEIAAGIGLADSLKEMGRTVLDMVRQAALAYPQLGRGLEAVTSKWAEFKIQAGAALLEVLQPALPMVGRLLDAAAGLAQKFPDAFDGARIKLAELVGVFREIPGAAQQAFGAAARAAAEFIQRAGFVLSLFGSDAGMNAADRLNAYANAQLQAGEQRRRAVREETGQRVTEIATTVRTPGPRRAVETPEQKRAREAAAREAQLLEAQNLARQRAERLAAAGGGNSLTGGPRAEQGLNAGVEAANAAQGATGILAGGLTAGEGSRLGEVAQEADGMSNTMRAAQQAFDAFNASGQAVSETLQQIAGRDTVAIGEGVLNMAEALGKSIPGFGGVAKAAKAAAGLIAKTEGTLAIGQGTIKVAKSLFPPNPPELASGLGMIRAGSQLMASLGAGGGAGGGAHGGGGGISPGGFQRNAAAAAESRKSKGIIVISDGVMHTRSPEFRDMITTVVKEAGELGELEVRIV